MKARIVLTAFAAALCLLSCQVQEEFVQVDNLLPANPVNNIEMTVEAAMPASKTVLDGTSVSWGSGEYLKVIETVGSATSGTAYTSAEGVVTGDKIAFPVTLTAQEGSSFNYYGLYPASAWATASNLTPSALKINLPEEQAPTATSWGDGADILICTPVTGSATQPTSLSVGFTRLSAVGKMTLINLETAEHVKTVTFTATGKGLAGQGVADLTAGTLTSGGSEDTITLDYTGAGISADGMTAIFTCWPVSLAAGDEFTVTVKTATKTWSKTVTLTGSQVLSFTSDRSSRFTMDMTGTLQPSVPASRYVKYTTAGSILSGTFLIVNETASRALNGALGSGMDVSGNYVNVTISGDAIVSNATVDAAAFTFTRKGGSNYHIRSVTGGYYIGATSVPGLSTSTTVDQLVNSVQLSGSNWTISDWYDNNNSYQLQYDSSAGRFRFFSSGSKDVIQLYKLETTDADPVTPDLDQTVYGQYLYTGEEVTYVKGTHQLSRTWSGSTLSTLTFSIYSPAAGTSFEMSGIPANPTLNQNFTLTVSRYTGLDPDSSAGYAVTVAKIDDSTATVWLTTAAGDCFIVKK